MPKKLKLSIFVVSILFASVLVFSNIAAAFTGNGAGTVGNPYQITTCEELQEMNDELDAHYILMNDINCSATSGWNAGAGFEPVGDSFTTFVGSLDGNNRTISNLFINRPSAEYIGLFGWLGNGSSVIDVTLANVDITGQDDVGGLAGRMYGSVSNAHVSGSVTADGSTGGVVGEQNGTLQDSSSSAVVAGNGETGGLAGYSQGNIIRSYASGNVTSLGDNLGGLVGYQYDDEIIDSYATGDVNGGWAVGGLVGYSEIGQITRSYSTGAVTGTDPAVGGLIGAADTPTVTDSFWDTQTSGQATSAGGEGKTTAELKDIATFQAATWDIGPGTVYLNNGYPFLSWQAGDTSPVWYITEAPAGGSGSNTTTFTNPLTDKQVTLEVDPSCDIQAASMTAESSNTVLDPGFDYPAGLMNFTLDCGTPGYTTTVTQYYYGLTNDNFVLRKHNPNTNAYFTIAGSTLEQTTHNGQAALKATYQATDGGDLDTDGTANGTIVDPVGLAQGAVGAPNTGLGGTARISLLHSQKMQVLSRVPNRVAPSTVSTM